LLMEAFHPLTIREVRRETADSVSLLLDVPPNLAPAFAFTAGQHLTLRAEIDGEDVRRNYSLCTAPHERELRVAIKAVPGGRFSAWANTHLQPGHSVEVMPPHGSFTWAFDPARAREYLGVAGGSGITPIMALLKTALIEEPRSRFTLLYSNRHSQSVMFADQLADLKDSFLTRLTLHHFLSAEFDDDLDLFNGRLDRAKADAVFATLVDSARMDAAFLCGPEGMMDAVEAALIARGMPAAAILSERFATGPVSAERTAAARALAEAATGLAVSVRLGGTRRTIAFDPALGNILDSARAAGLPAPYACKAGVCATCRARVTAGKVEMTTNYGLSATEVAAGYVLTCQSVPVGPGVAVDYDA